MTAPFADQVAEYLAYCAEHARLLSPDYHPTADGAVKVIWHRGADQAAQIRAAFRAAAGASSATSAAGARAVTPRATLDLDAGFGEAG
jgi:hypothetical protein